MLKPYLAKVINGQDLSEVEAEEAMNIIMTGQATQAQIGGYLTALRMKGETVAEITGSARAMRANAVPVPLSEKPVPLFDTAGTGGDGAFTFNISTAAAFVIAGTGRKVAKHGNRAASSQCGSADVLAALGLNLDLTPEQVGRAIEEIGIGFLFAPKFHPAMKHAVGPRKELGQRTIFNVLGPLTNPAGADVQLMGVYSPSLTEPIANVLLGLGTRAALVICGYGGTDELNPCGPNLVSQLKDGKVKTYMLDPQSLGMPKAAVEDLRGGAPADNAKMMIDVLNGGTNGALRDAVLLNSAAILAAESGDFEQGLAESREAIASGAARQKLDLLVEYSKAYVQSTY